jgi:hypothetical protein
VGNRPWQRENPEAFLLLRERLRVDFPELHPYERGEVVVVSGIFPLVNGSKVVDRYRIEIELPKTYPKGIPVLREIGGRIPHDPDRHVGTDGKACPFLPDEYCYNHPEGMDLIEFLKGPVLTFFVCQGLVEMRQRWPPEAERGHGEKGIIAFYGELLGSEDRLVIQRHLEVLSANRLRGHWECPCGSGKRIRQCHWDRFEELRARIPASVARRSLEMISRTAPRR